MNKSNLKWEIFVGFIANLWNGLIKYHIANYAEMTRTHMKYVKIRKELRNESFRVILLC